MACSRPPLPMTSIFTPRWPHALPTTGIITLRCKPVINVIVVGAGHAGCEAARACARLGLKTAMVTMNLDLIAQMSCNPAVGGSPRVIWCARSTLWAA